MIPHRARRRVLRQAALMLGLVLAGVAPQDAWSEGGRGPVTSLPLPRYVSLKASEANARRGPSLSHRIDWVFRHRDMPLRVTGEFGNWRRIEDSEGQGGWVHYTLISGVRTVLFESDPTSLRSRPDRGADEVARAQPGAIGRLGQCVPDWCRVSAGGERGWVEKTSLWGVDPDELRD
jgi:SH3-like domain-containing protein